MAYLGTVQRLLVTCQNKRQGFLLGGWIFVKGVDDDFGLAEYSNRKEGGANPPRGIATHGFMLPWAGFIGPCTSAMGNYGLPAWKADLAAM